MDDVSELHSGEIKDLLRSLHEEQLRDVVNRFLQVRGFYSDLVHGSAEHGKDIVALVPAELDVAAGLGQVLLIQVKTGDISERRWGSEVKPQFRDVLDSCIRHPRIDEKLSKRHILITSGRLTETAKQSIHDYNDKTPVPVEVIDVEQLSHLMLKSGFYKQVLDRYGTLKSDPSACEAVLGYIAGVSTSTKRTGVSLSELTKGLERLNAERVSQAVDTLIDSGLIRVRVKSGEHPNLDTRRSFEVGEMAARVSSVVPASGGSFSFNGAEAALRPYRRFIESLASKLDPCLVVAVERKGTALLGALLAAAQRPCDLTTSSLCQSASANDPPRATIGVVA